MTGISLLLLLLSVALAPPVLHLVDCGPHGDLMYSLIREEGFAGDIERHTTSLSTPPECVNQPPLDSVLARILNNLSLPARLSLSLGTYNLSFISLPLQWLLEEGVEVWASAGNEGLEGCSWPASQLGVTAVRAPDSNLCLGKNRSQLIVVEGACSSSEATARAAARGSRVSFAILPRNCDPYPWQWHFAGAMLAILICVPLVVLFLLWAFGRRIAGPVQHSPV
jgi:hypothetical protein